MTLIDTPGVLSGEKQRIGRNYDMAEVCQKKNGLPSARTWSCCSYVESVLSLECVILKVCKWFAERSDLILLLFDAHKLDISDELKIVIENLRGNHIKIRIVLIYK